MLSHACNIQDGQSPRNDELGSCWDNFLLFRDSTKHEFCGWFLIGCVCPWVRFDGTLVNKHFVLRFLGGVWSVRQERVSDSFWTSLFQKFSSKRMKRDTISVTFSCKSRGVIFMPLSAIFPRIKWRGVILTPLLEYNIYYIGNYSAEVILPGGIYGVKGKLHLARFWGNFWNSRVDILGHVPWQKKK